MLYMEISNGCELHFISSTPNQVQCIPVVTILCHGRRPVKYAQYLENQIQYYANQSFSVMIRI